MPKKLSVCMVVILAIFFSAWTVLAQQAVKPIVDLSGEKIVQFTLVTKDVEKVARRFSTVFGNSWKFYDFRPKQIVLHDKALGDVDCYLKVALGTFGGRSFKLVQPVSGQSSYMEFLKKNGEGFYTFSLGTLPSHDNVISALKKAGVIIEMQGSLGNNATFTIIDTVDDLGCRIELNSPANQAFETNMQLTGVYVPSGSSIINMGRPIFAGGKKFTQVGIVLKDEKKAAQRFQELFGIGPWRVLPIAKKTDAFLNERPVSEAGMPALHNDAAFANLGDIQFELLKPIGLGPSCHQWFFEKHGNGIQHLSFGRQADYDDVITALKRSGINSEYSATLGGASVVNYLAMQDELGGFQLEITKSK